jgi:flavin-dependent dehydrogenase
MRPESKINRVFDATVIGGGPAGSVAAIALARRGLNVALLEQHRFPRDKVCGECLSALGIEVLDRLELRDAVSRSHPVRLSRTALVAPSGKAATIALPRVMWGLSRAALDTTLLEAARSAGAAVLQPARCESVDAPRARVVIRDLVSNDTRELSSRFILVADGKAACGLAPRPRPTGDLGIKAHFTGVRDASDTISLFGLRGHYVGLAPIENGRWNVAMSVPAARVKSFAGDLDALFAQCLRENAGLADRFGHAGRATDWLAAPLPRFAVARRWPANVLPLGNAAAALEPIGGEGMGLAMRSAELAAEAVCDAVVRGGAVAIKGLRRSFDELWNRRRFAARSAARLMSSPRAAEWTVALLRRNQSLAFPALAPLGKL